MGRFLRNLRRYGRRSCGESETRSEYGVRIVSVRTRVPFVFVEPDYSRTRAGSAVEEDFPTAGGIVSYDSEIIAP